MRLPRCRRDPPLTAAEKKWNNLGSRRHRGGGVWGTVVALSDPPGPLSSPGKYCGATGKSLESHMFLHFHTFGHVQTPSPQLCVFSIFAPLPSPSVAQDLCVFLPEQIASLEELAPMPSQLTLGESEEGHVQAAHDVKGFFWLRVFFFG